MSTIPAFPPKCHTWIPDTEMLLRKRPLISPSQPFSCFCSPPASFYSPRGKTAGPCCCRGYCWGGWRQWCRQPTQPSRPDWSSPLPLPGPWARPGSLPSGQQRAKSAWVGGTRGKGRRTGTGAGTEGEGGESVSQPPQTQRSKGREEMETQRRKREGEQMSRNDWGKIRQESERRHELLTGWWEELSRGQGDRRRVPAPIGSLEPVCWKHVVSSCPSEKSKL